MKLFITLGMTLLSASTWGVNSAIEQKVHNQVLADLTKVNHIGLHAFNQKIRPHGVGGFVTAGNDPACDFNVGLSRIQDAIDSGAEEIRVATNQIYFENLVLDDIDVIIRGGYSDCTQADSGLVSVTKTTIDGSANSEPAISITGNSNKHMIVLENFIITNSTKGGINTINADTDLLIKNIQIISNSNALSQGGGIFIFIGDTDLIAQDVVIIENSANFGGGLGCQGFQASVLMLGNSSIMNNTATGPGSGTSSSGTGGGVFLGQTCTFSMYSGPLEAPASVAHQDLPYGLLQPHIYNNKANGKGGGINSINGSKLFLFGQKMCVDGECLGDDQTPFIFANNESDFNLDGTEAAGGIRLFESGSDAIINGALIQGNRAGGNGGAFLVQDGARLEIYRRNGACWSDDFNPVFCNAMFDNTSTTNIGFGGSIYSDNGVVDISSTFISESRADFGTVLYATGDQSTSRFEGVIFNENGNDGADDYSDNFVIAASLGAAVELIHTTFTDNQAESAVLDIDVGLGTALNLQSSIIFDTNSGNVLNSGGADITINCLMAHEDSSFTGTAVVVDNPLFLNVADGDFSLTPTTSPAIDFCDDAQAEIQHLDIINEGRGWDDPAVPNLNGAFDLGAIESISNDIIFEDGFE